MGAEKKDSEYAEREHSQAEVERICRETLGLEPTLCLPVAHLLECDEMDVEAPGQQDAKTPKVDPQGRTRDKPGVLTGQPTVQSCTGLNGQEGNLRSDSSRKEH